MNSSIKLILSLAFAAAVVGGGLYLYRSRAKAAGEAQAAQKGGADKAGGRAVPVLTAVVDKRDVPVWLDGLGTVAAFKQVTIHPQVDGRLDTVFFKEGQLVHRGEALAQIDPRPFQVQLHQAEGALARDRAQLQDNKVNLERYKALRKENLIAQQQVDDQAAMVGTSEGTILVDQAAVESARLNLDYAHITAPLEGVVGVRLVDPGNLVHANDPIGIVVLTQLDPAAVLFTLPQDDLPRVAAAQAKGTLVVEAWSRDGLTRLGKGTLSVVDNQINQATSTIRLKAIFDNPTRALWPNQFVKARLLVDTERGALVIPAASIQRGPQAGATFVYTVGADKLAAVRTVKLAFITGDLAVISDGLEVGEQVVTEGQNQLRPGTAVTIRPTTGGLQKVSKGPSK
jgi:membrane fusion protein, multidrug efflux system